MRRPFVKVCGITRVEDALSAVGSGVDAIGLVLAPESPRVVTVKEAAEIARRLPPEIARVGVVVNLPIREVRDLVRRIGLTAIQAHGEEPASECRDYGVPVIKAIPAGETFDPAVLESYGEFPVLLDAAGAGQRGGTGRLANWAAAVAAREAGFRILLAGGLRPGNLLEAIKQVGPLAVDLNSGVESEPGVKDLDLIRGAMARLADLDPPDGATWPW